MILEVAFDFTKLAAFSNFPHMFLQSKIHAQNTENSFEHDLDLVSRFSGRWKGLVHKSRKIWIIWRKNIRKKHWNSENLLYLVGGGRGSARSTKKKLWVLVSFPRSATPLQSPLIIYTTPFSDKFLKKNKSLGLSRSLTVKKRRASPQWLGRRSKMRVLQSTSELEY